jgi:hypothetical protein
VAWDAFMMRMWSRASRRGADHAFAVGVHLGCAWGAEQDFCVFGGEDGVEGEGVLGVAVAEQEPGLSCAFGRCGGELGGLLDCPLPGWLCGGGGEVESAGAVFQEGHGVEVLASAVSGWK